MLLVRMQKEQSVEINTNDNINVFVSISDNKISNLS